MNKYYDLNYAKLDTDREKRTGFPEVVFCEGKPDEYLIGIYKRLIEIDGRVFGTRASQHQYEIIREVIPEIEYNSVSRILKYNPSSSNAGNDKENANAYNNVNSDNDVNAGNNADMNTGNSVNENADNNADTNAENKNVKSGDSREGIGLIAVCTGGTADIPVAEEAAETAEYFGGKVRRIYDVGVSGIHRVLSKVDDIREANCVIVVAGMEGALVSVIGGLVENPVIAVPTSVGYGASLGGISALLTMINSCANGITVVNIDNGYGAGYVATQINRLAERNPH